MFIVVLQFYRVLIYVVAGIYGHMHLVGFIIWFSLLSLQSFKRTGLQVHMTTQYNYGTCATQILYLSWSFICHTDVFFLIEMMIFHYHQKKSLHKLCTSLVDLRLVFFQKYEKIEPWIFWYISFVWNVYNVDVGFSWTVSLDFISMRLLNLSCDCVRTILVDCDCVRSTLVIFECVS